MRIELKQFYRGGASQFGLIEPGIYDVNDPRLRGAGAYLIETNHAVALDAPEPTTPPQPPEPVDPDGTAATGDGNSASADNPDGEPPTPDENDGVPTKWRREALEAKTQADLAVIAVGLNIPVAADARKAHLVQDILDAQEKDVTHE